MDIYRHRGVHFCHEFVSGPWDPLSSLSLFVYVWVVGTTSKPMIAMFFIVSWCCVLWHFQYFWPTSHRLTSNLFTLVYVYHLCLTLVYSGSTGWCFDPGTDFHLWRRALGGLLLCAAVNGRNHIYYYIAILSILYSIYTHISHFSVQGGYGQGLSFMFRMPPGTRCKQGEPMCFKQACDLFRGKSCGFYPKGSTCKSLVDTSGSVESFHFCCGWLQFEVRTDADQEQTLSLLDFDHDTLQFLSHAAETVSELQCHNLWICFY